MDYVIEAMNHRLSLAKQDEEEAKRNAKGMEELLCQAQAGHQAAERVVRMIEFWLEEYQKDSPLKTS